MQLISIFSMLLLAGSAFAVRVTYDNTYDNAGGSMWNVACSNGKNGLVERFPTFGDMPTFPNISGVQGVSWNSTKCGSCWKLTFKNESTLVTAVDYAGNGFNVAQAALDALTDGNAVKWGSADVQAEEVSRAQCGL